MIRSSNGSSTTTTTKSRQNNTMRRSGRSAALAVVTFLGSHAVMVAGSNDLRDPRAIRKRWHRRADAQPTLRLESILSRIHKAFPKGDDRFDEKSAIQIASGRASHSWEA
jgi:hypothetical protein